jgi:23S rRNA pseudouridine1911/1915/1917 synthase
MLTASGYRHTLTVFGIILGVVGALAALGLSAPRADELLPAPARNLSTCVHDTAPKEMLKTPLFWLMFAMMTMMSTGGLMVVAKTERAYTALKRAFKEREVDKVYHTVVQGHPDPLVGTIDAPLGRHPNHSWKFAVIPDGKDSVTHYETLEAFPRASLLEVHLETGRTHQIRVHMAAHRHPCVGDPLYGGDPTLAQRLGLTRQWLHAHELSFAHPATGDWVTFRSEYPADLAHALEILRDQ